MTYALKTLDGMYSRDSLRLGDIARDSPENVAIDADAFGANENTPEAGGVAYAKEIAVMSPLATACSRTASQTRTPRLMRCVSAR